VTHGLHRVTSFLAPDPAPKVGTSYAIRTAGVAAIAFVLYRFVDAHVGTWAAVSAIVVIQPDNRASISNAFLRVVANLLGVGVGVATGALFGDQLLLALVTSMLVVAGLCRWLALDVAARSACAAVAIVLLVDPADITGSSELRVIGVVCGCAIALVVTIATTLATRDR
jgi:uncharacterized membrane protein YgaE (UPF0421/DUF939 family)